MNKRLLPRLAVGLVAIEHVYILVLEMFLWNKPAGLRTFKLTQEFADATLALAATRACTTAFLRRDCSGACSPATAASSCSFWPA
jgi:putative membrane protein